MIIFVYIWPIIKVLEIFVTLLSLDTARIYAEKGRHNGRVYCVCPPVCIFHLSTAAPLQQRAAGLLLGARRAGDIDRQHGAQQQMRAVPRLQSP